MSLGSIEVDGTGDMDGSSERNLDGDCDGMSLGSIEIDGTSVGLLVVEGAKDGCIDGSFVENKKVSSEKLLEWNVLISEPSRYKARYAPGSNPSLWESYSVNS